MPKKNSNRSKKDNCDKEDNPNKSEVTGINFFPTAQPIQIPNPSFIPTISQTQLLETLSPTTAPISFSYPSAFPSSGNRQRNDNDFNSRNLSFKDKIFITSGIIGIISGTFFIFNMVRAWTREIREWRSQLNDQQRDRGFVQLPINEEDAANDDIEMSRVSTIPNSSFSINPRDSETINPLLNTTSERLEESKDRQENNIRANQVQTGR